ncbi:oxygen-insensitive NADPH nitroreductase [Ligilactobacillus animalis]|nr:oxygen-insensitive NADPH nitroreductase [Ligilactobacillus animalis]
METLDVLRSHVSVRDFKAEPLDKEVKKQLLLAAHAGSSSNFVQAVSIIEVTDEKIRSQIAQISQSAAYVNKSGAFYVFVADLYRQAFLLKKHKKSLAPLQNMESLLVSVVDTTIAGENMAVAAEALGLGICFIGGIRNDLNKVSELLHLPPYTVPLFGLTIGIPATKNGIKPRLPLKNFVSENGYDTQNFTDLAAYDAQMKDYYLSRSSNPKDMDWSRSQLQFFKEIRRSEVRDFIRKQGFVLE